MAWKGNTITMAVSAAVSVNNSEIGVVVTQAC